MQKALRPQAPAATPTGAKRLGGGDSAAAGWAVFDVAAVAFEAIAGLFAEW